MRRTTFWPVPRAWSGETVFIVAGGPSVLEHDLQVLRGRHVIAINSSVHAVPWADYLYFGDYRWWREPENYAAVESFAGRVITTSRMVSHRKVLVCNKANPPGLAAAPDALMQKATSLTAATNLAVHLIGRGGTIVWLGADGRRVNGRTHHHRPHRWPHKPDCYARHRADIVTIVEPLREMGIALFIAGAGAYADLFPTVSLQDLLRERAAA